MCRFRQFCNSVYRHPSAIRSTITVHNPTQHSPASVLAKHNLQDVGPHSAHQLVSNEDRLDQLPVSRNMLGNAASAATSTKPKAFDAHGAVGGAFNGRSSSA